MEDRLYELVERNAKVKIIDIDGIEYVGVVRSFTSSVDEDNGYASIVIATEDKGWWSLSENEIKSVEEITLR